MSSGRTRSSGNMKIIRVDKEFADYLERERQRIIQEDKKRYAYERYVSDREATLALAKRLNEIDNEEQRKEKKKNFKF